jgi:hypothetical protein
MSRGRQTARLFDTRGVQVAARSNLAVPTTKKMVDGVMLSTIHLSLGHYPVRSKGSSAPPKSERSLYARRLGQIMGERRHRENDAQRFVMDETGLALSRS